MINSTRSIIDPWYCYEQALLFARLGLVHRADRWAVLETIRDAELGTIEASLLDQYRGQLAKGMALAPMLQGRDLDELSARCVANVFKRNLHTTSILAELAAGHPIEEIVMMESLGPLRDLVSDSGSVAILPVHAGAIEAGIVALSRCLPLTMLVSQGANVPDVVDSRYTDLLGPLDLEILRAPSTDVLLKCVKAVRRRRCVVFPPEFTSKDSDSVVPLEVAGRVVGVPDGYVRFAHRMRIPLMVVTFEQRPDYRYQFALRGPFSAGDTADGGEGCVPAAVEGVFSVVAEILASRPDDWEGWWMFDRMVADGERLRLPA